MSDHRLWLRFSLKSLFLLMLVVASFVGGYSVAIKQSERAVNSEREARLAAEQAAQEAHARAARLHAWIDGEASAR